MTYDPFHHQGPVTPGCFHKRVVGDLKFQAFKVRGRIYRRVTNWKTQRIVRDGWDQCGCAPPYEYCDSCWPTTGPNRRGAPHAHMIKRAIR